MSKTKRTCEQCHREFFVWPSAVLRSGARFCSNSCARSGSPSKPITRVNRNCLECGTKVIATPSQVERGRGRFCSRSCASAYTSSKRKINDSTRKKIGLAHKGKTIAKDTRKKLSAALKGRRIDDQAHRWRGADVGYGGLHTWVSKKLGKPTRCEHCGKDGLRGGSIHWANKSGEYKRELGDWIRLCVSCHKTYDLNRLQKKL